MIPIYKILNFWTEFKREPFQKKYVDIPIVIVAMKKNEAVSLFNEDAQDNIELKKAFSHDGLQAVLSQYSDKRDHWRPINFEGKTIENLISDLIENINNWRMENQSSEYFRPKFLTDQLFDDDEDIQYNAREELVASRGIVVVDCISLFHDGIRKKIFYDNAVGSPETKVAILIINPLNRRALQTHKVIQRKVPSFIQQVYFRFAKEFDEECEFGTDNLSVERWFFRILNSVPKTPKESRVNPQKRKKFRRMANKTACGMDKMISGEGNLR